MTRAAFLLLGKERFRVSALFGVDVPYYYEMRFFEFADFVDLLGGIDAYVPKAMTVGEIVRGGDVSLDQGEQHLNGVQALELVRQRKIYEEEGEACRQLNAREVVSGVIQYVANHSAAEMEGFAQMLESTSKTNMSHEQLMAYLTAFAEQEEPISFNLGTAPYQGGIDANGDWGVAYDGATYDALREAMENGTDMSEIVSLPTPY